MLTAWDTLEQHAEAWVQSLPEAHACLGEGVVQTLRERAAKHYHPAFEAAYYLDPLNFEQEYGAEHAHPNLITLSDRQMNAIKVC